jgi:hypothetical protein
MQLIRYSDSQEGTRGENGQLHETSPRTCLRFKSNLPRLASNFAKTKCENTKTSEGPIMIQQTKAQSRPATRSLHSKRVSCSSPELPIEGQLLQIRRRCRGGHCQKAPARISSAFRSWHARVPFTAFLYIQTAAGAPSRPPESHLR